MPMLMPPPAGLGVAPPMAGGPAQWPGPLKEARQQMMEAARRLFDAIEKAPELAKELNDIIEQLTTVIRQSAEPPGIPPAGPEEMAGPPALDTTPSGPPAPGGLRSPLTGGAGGGALPAMILARLAGGG